MPSQETLTNTIFAPYLKNMWHKGRVNDMAMRSQPFFAMVPKATDFFGDDQKVTVKYSNPQGRSHTASKVYGGGANQTGTKAVRFAVTRASSFSAASIDGETIESTSNNIGALLKAVDNEISGAMQNESHELGRQLVGAGGTSRGRISTATAPQNPGGADDYIVLNTARDARFFEVNQTLSCGTTDGNTSGTVRSTPAAARITRVERNRSDGTSRIYFAENTFSGTNWAVGDYLFTDGDASSSNVGLGMKGLQAWLPTTVSASDSFFGVNRHVDRDRLAGLYLDYSTKTIENALTYAAADLDEVKGRPTHCFVSPRTHAKLKVSLGSSVQYDPNVRGFGDAAKITFGALVLPTAAGDIKIMGDRNFPDDEAYLLQMDTWKFHSLYDAPRIVRHDGNTTLRMAAADGVEFRVVWRGNLECDAPGWNARVLLQS